MALSLPPGLLPSEVAFLCEMELVTIVPRQKLDSIDLLAKQRRANIVPPPWLHPDSLRDVIRHETKVDTTGWAPPPPPPSRADARGNATRIGDALSDPPGTVLSPPFLPSCTTDSPSGHLPYHWFELAEMLLAHAGDDMVSASEVRSLLRDLQEVRAAKMRSSTAQLENGVDGVMSLRGVGAMELAESRGFVTGVVEGVRKIGASAEAGRREEEERAGVDDEPARRGADGPGGAHEGDCRDQGRGGA
ncbi:DNA replication protein psf2, partial [Claviceps sorghi]